jgi:hypothetical protein
MRVIQRFRLWEVHPWVMFVNFDQAIEDLYIEFLLDGRFET